MDFPGHFQHIFQELNQQRLRAQLCDCVVAVGGRSFQAHRSILAACSSHFRALLISSDGGDKVAADKGVIELDPEVVTPEAFSTLLDMIYTSTLSLGASNVMDVLLAASNLHLNAVVKACKLHLSRKNFPSSPPEGWRSVQQQQQQQRTQAEWLVTSGVDEEVGEEEAGAEVSQSVGSEDQGTSRKVAGEQSDPFARHKRRSEEDSLSGRKRSCRLLEGSFKERSPTVTRSTVGTEEQREELPSPDCPRTTGRLWGGRVEEEEEEEEEKYEATKGKSEEFQLPSQSDSSAGGAVVLDGGGHAGENAVVKVKVGDEGEDSDLEPKAAVMEVKTEHQNSPDEDMQEDRFPPQVHTDGLDSPGSDEKTAAASPADGDVGTLRAQLCADLQTESQREDGRLGEETADTGEGLDSLAELTFSCLLNPDNETGAPGEEDSLASLTAAAANASGGDPAGEQRRSSEVQPSDSSSLLFPAPPVPVRQLVPAQVSGFSDALILHPTHRPLAGFLSGIRPSLCLGAALIKPPRGGKSSAATTFRRIAPKVPPGSEADTDHAAAGEAADRPLLTRASEDVLSKCKKAAAEDNVLLVDGGKKYACQICRKTFMNLTDCKKHIRVHTGEKPYPCPKCGKCFSQSSHLYKHSKNSCLNWKEEQAFADSLL
ncbi:zinc finger and BTB domain-containing protein 5-like [Brachionichthys hirsutus]|uniref:zinc finger and BTB domain-containing protein 5-like n=1 Tax=Brachionichthys hirsutus TaxID=412623 RepID=UPI0036051C43